MNEDGVNVLGLSREEFGESSARISTIPTAGI
jgi:hypothetical protein